MRTSFQRLAWLALLPSTALAQWSTDSLSSARWYMGATAVGDVALFAGGSTCVQPPITNCNQSVVDAYDASTGTWSTAALSVPRHYMGAATAGSRAMFAGGWLNPNFAQSQSAVDVYDASLGAPDDPLAWSVESLSMARGWVTGVSHGDLALFAGGSTGGVSPTAHVDRIDVYDALTDTWSTASLSLGRCCMGSVAVGNKVLFAGGVYSNGSTFLTTTRVDIYDATLGPPSQASAWSTSELSEARALLGATAVGTLAIFAGGADPATPSAVVDIYDSATNTWSTASLSQARRFVAATTVGDLALFAGGETAVVPGPYPVVAATDVVDVYDAATGTWSVTTLASARAGASAVSLGDRALFAGGATPIGVSSKVDVYSAVFGEPFCSQATTNSTGSAGDLHVTGRSAAASNDLDLHARALPVGAFGFFLTSRTHGAAVQPASSQGLLCLNGSIGRFVGPGQIQQVSSTGAFELTLDLTKLPTPGGLVAAAPGESWSFQAWHRDAVGGVATSNFTDGVSLTFD